MDSRLLVLAALAIAPGGAAQGADGRVVRMDGAVVWRGRSAETITTAGVEVPPFDRAVLSWNARGEARFELEAGGTWHVMGTFGARPEGVKTADVDVDTLVLKEPATSFRVRATPAAGGVVTLLAVATWKEGDAGAAAAERSPAWGKILDVPRRSQRDAARNAGSVCSPTSVAMVLEFHGCRKTTEEAAEGVFDRAQKVYGNWPLNCAWAHSVSDLEAWVIRPKGFEAIEAEIAAGRPVVISHRWKEGDLDGAPIRSSNGHLLVVAGFAESGDVVVNDPAAPRDSVRRTYRRDQIRRTWRELGSGIAYVFRRPG